MHPTTIASATKIMGKLSYPSDLVSRSSLFTQEEEEVAEEE